MNRDPTLCHAFVSCAKHFLSVFPQVRHTWSVDADEDHCILDIPEQCPDGFPVTVEVWPDRAMILGLGAHVHEEPQGTPSEFAAHLVGFMADLLSPAMRVRERSSNGRAIRWAFEMQIDGEWRAECSTGLMFWNYFGRRTERLYQNTLIPRRTWPLEQGGS